MIYSSWDVEQNILKLVIFCPFTPYKPQKSRFYKMKIFAGDIIILHVYQKSQSYNVRFRRYEVWQTEFFVIMDRFLPFYPPPPLTTRKIKILKNWEKSLELSSFYQKCTRNHDHMLYHSLDMARNGFNYFSFWAIF